MTDRRHFDRFFLHFLQDNSRLSQKNEIKMTGIFFSILIFQDISRHFKTCLWTAEPFNIFFLKCKDVSRHFKTINYLKVITLNSNYKKMTVQDVSRQFKTQYFIIL